MVLITFRNKYVILILYQMTLKRCLHKRHHKKVNVPSGKIYIVYKQIYIINVKNATFP